MDRLEPVELRGDLVGVEPLRREHAAGLLAAASEEVFAHLPYPAPTSLDEARAWIDEALAAQRANRRVPFAIRAADGGAVIGSSSYYFYDAANANVEIGSSWFERSRWRSGANAETKLLLLTHAFETLGLERVAFRTDIRNERSQGAIERLGASKEGVHRHEMRRRDGSWRDSVHYGLLRAEWPAAKEELRARLAAAR